MLVQITIQVLDYSLLVWIGSMYAPLLPFFGVAANVAQFYVKKLLALYLYTPPKERYSASRTNVIVYCLMLGRQFHDRIATLSRSHAGLDSLWGCTCSGLVHWLGACLCDAILAPPLRQCAQIVCGRRVALRLQRPAGIQPAVWA